MLLFEMTRSPVIFQALCTTIRRLYDDDPDLSLSLCDVAQITRAPTAACTAATAALVNGRDLKWTAEDRLVRVDSIEADQKRRTA